MKSILCKTILGMLFVATQCIVFSQQSFSKNEITSILEKETILKGIKIEDVKEYFISDNYFSKGINHVYLNQAIDGIPIYQTHLDLHVFNSKLYSNIDLISNLSSLSIKKINSQDATNVIIEIAKVKNYDLTGEINEIANQLEQKKLIKYEAPKISLSPIISKLWFYKKSKKELIPIWQITIEQVSDAFLKQFLVDANSGEIIKEIDLTLTCDFGICNSKKSHTECDHYTEEKTLATNNSYHVFSWPMENPHDGPRLVEVEPWLDNVLASPFGWHTIGSNNYQHTRGNNVDAYEDTNNSNSPSGGNSARGDGGMNLDFDFPWSTSTPLSDFQDAAITNLFYWTNICHDVWYNYGFDEPSGNFQEENYSNNGLGSDYVKAEAQDGGGTCNANFNTPSDGGNPRMQMYNCTSNGNSRDGSFDNLIIVHEYGHGISIRLTGGPSNSGCLGNIEQMGEGWSDYFATVMTIKPSDLSTDSRGIGTWLFGEGPNGSGIRPYPYSTDFVANPMTYDYLKQSNISAPHGIGSVWATMLWDMTWNFIDKYGFDPDIYNGTGGNNLAMQLVIEGLKLQPCSPGFIDGRDAILAADLAINNGENQCLIWNSFAKRGLGYSASQGSSNSRSDGTESFDLPPGCSINTIFSVDKINTFVGDTLRYTAKIKNILPSDILGISIKSFIPDTTSLFSVSNGGSVNSGEIDWPVVDLLKGDSLEYTFDVVIDSNKSNLNFDIVDNVESGNNRWTVINSGSTQFHIQTGSGSSNSNAWYSQDASTTGEANLILTDEIGIDTNTTFSFTHSYDTEVNWDGGRVFITLDNGATWLDLGPYFIQNGYNDFVFNTIPGFSGNSNGHLTSIIDLSSFVGKAVKLKFQMVCDAYVGGNGWSVDDINISNAHHLISNKVYINCSLADFYTNLDLPTFIKPISSINYTLNTTDVSCGSVNDGAIGLSISGGTGNYTYNWNNGITSKDQNNLNGGTYIVTITDGNSTLVDSAIVLNGRQSMVTDKNDNGGTHNLRYFTSVNLCPNDTILFHSDFLNDTIHLSSAISTIGDVFILGLGKHSLNIDINALDVLFSVNENTIVKIEGLKLLNGKAPINGGALYNKGQLTLKNVILEHNYEQTMPKAFTNDGTIIFEGTVEIKE